MKYPVACLKLIILSLLSMQGVAQHYYLPLNHEYMSRQDSLLQKVGVPFHTSVKPYNTTEMQQVVVVDSISRYRLRDNRFRRTLVGRKIFNEHLLQVREEDYFLYGDINFEFNGGQSMETDTTKNNFINSRGFILGGTFGKNFSFVSSFVESQATYSSYIDTLVKNTYVIPGGSRIKRFDEKYDYGTAYGTISYSLKKYFNFQLGHDKNFIGDGYRSLLLSDHAYNYPFLKINANFWKVKYMVMYMVMMDGPYPNDDQSYRRKYGTFHYLDLNIGKRLTFGILESVIWKYEAERGFDVNYINPIIFYRPVEYSIGSPDNVIMGVNLKYKLNSRNNLYAQALLDEFKINEVRAGNGWWANKYGFQLGWRAFSLFRIRNLDVQTEVNYVRPYTYQHRSSVTSYSHYNMPLAHPLGANFTESVSSLSYSFRRWHLLGRVSLAEVGYDVDSTGQVVNYGNNVLLSYETRPSDYGHETGQGLKTNLLNSEFRIWYLLNPASNLGIEVGARYRQSKNAFGEQKTLFPFVGIRTHFTNRYLDF